MPTNRFSINPLKVKLLAGEQISHPSDRLTCPTNSGICFMSAWLSARSSESASKATGGAPLRGQRRALPGRLLPATGGAAE